jgi:hypothetical protein
MIASSVWWFLIMYGRYGSLFIQRYFGANVFRRLSMTITTPKTMARGFHYALLRHTSSFTLLIGVIGLLLLLFLLLLPRSRRKEFSSFRLEGDPLLIPFLLFSGTYYLIFARISRTFLWWYPFPLFPILALGQGYFFWICLEASSAPKDRGWPFQVLPLFLPLMALAFTLSHGLSYLLIGLLPLFFLYLVILWGRRGGSVYGKNGQTPNLLSTLGLLTLAFYFSLSAYLVLQAPTYHSPDRFQQIAMQVKALSPVEVLFDEALDHERQAKIARFHFYLELPIRRVEIEPYLRGKEDGKRRVLFTSPERWKVLGKWAKKVRVELAAGGDFLLLQIEQGGDNKAARLPLNGHWREAMISRFPPAHDPKGSSRVIQADSTLDL